MYMKIKSIPLVMVPIHTNNTNASAFYFTPDSCDVQSYPTRDNNGPLTVGSTFTQTYITTDAPKSILMIFFLTLVILCI